MFSTFSGSSLNLPLKQILDDSNFLLVYLLKGLYSKFIFIFAVKITAISKAVLYD